VLSAGRGGARGGLLVSTAIGFIGALLGPWIARQFHLAEPFVLRVSGYSFPILWSIIGGSLVCRYDPHLMTLNAGTRLGPYRIESAIGAGGMGEVYRARDTRLDGTLSLVFA
jgi:uncharacterized membrane protein YeaQ/YmgE (transglycosylase-associated protein family)